MGGSGNRSIMVGLDQNSKKGSSMFIVSTGFLLAGVALSAAAQASPRSRSALEWAGGTLLIAGLSLIGAGLRLFR